MESQDINMIWVIFCACLVMLMQAGFLCLESGLTRTKNSINVAVKNLADFGLSILLFWAMGFGLMFGTSYAGLIGSDTLFVPISNEQPWLTTVFIFQAMFCGTAVTLVSGAVAERMSFFGYLLIAVLVSVLIYPLFGHWAWGGLMGGESGWLGNLGFIDFAGSTVVHGVGGWVALAAIIVIGPRAGRFLNNSPAPQIINGQSLPLAMLGALLLLFGWIGFNGGSTLAWGGDVPAIIGKTFLAASSGMITALAAGWATQHYADPKLIMNGLLAGLVAITAGCNVVSAPAAIFIGAAGALCMMQAERLLLRFKLDDVVSAFPVHAAAGIWGTLAVALFADPTAFAPGVTWFDQFGIQLLGVVTCALVSFVPTYLFLSGIQKLFSLRVTIEQEAMGLNASEHRTTTEHLDLLREMEAHSQDMDLAQRVSVEPYTEIGQIAQKYNEVLDSLQHTIARNEMIVGDTKEGILTCSMNGRVLSANPGAEVMFGYSMEETVGKSIWSLISTESSAFFESFSDFLNHREGQRRSDDSIKLFGIKKSGEQFRVGFELVRGVIAGEQVATLRFRDHSDADRYQDQLRHAKDEAIRARDQLEDKVHQIEAFNHLALDRETRMIELKQQINRLSLELEREPPFSIGDS